MRHILPLPVALFPISSDAWAWGDEGHKVIREIALRLVQPRTRATPPRRPSDCRASEQSGGVAGQRAAERLVLPVRFYTSPRPNGVNTDPVWEVQGGHMPGGNQ